MKDNRLFCVLYMDADKNYSIEASMEILLTLGYNKFPLKGTFTDEILDTWCFLRRQFMEEFNIYIPCIPMYLKGFFDITAECNTITIYTRGTKLP